MYRTPYRRADFFGGGRELPESPNLLSFRPNGEATLDPIDIFRPMHVTAFFRDGLDRCVRHAGKNFKRSGKVNLIHLLENEAAHRKRSDRQLWLGSLTNKQRNAHRDLSRKSLFTRRDATALTRPRPSGYLGRCELALQVRPPRQVRSRRRRRGRR
jgi:hypothetical protein